MEKGGFKEAYTLYLADSALILGHRNSEWCGHGPVLEQDIAISNISLDLIGQARNFYQYAAALINALQTSINGGDPITTTEDSLAYFRNSHDFRNLLITEQSNSDWAKTILRQFFFSAYQNLLFQQLKDGEDEQLAAIASKSLKEIAYHLRWSSEWVIRLGDGTDESHARIVKAVDELWPYTGEFFIAAAYEEWLLLNNYQGIDLSDLKKDWLQKVKDIFDEAGLAIPASTPFQVGGKQGKHSEQLTLILNELQSVARAYPDAQW